MEEDLEIQLLSGKDVLLKVTKNTLVGRILAGKGLNKKGVMGVSRSTWPLKEIIEKRELNANLYSISFDREEYMEEVLENSPRSVMRYCLSLRGYEIDHSVHNICFTSAPFWIQVHKLPLEMMTFQNAGEIGKTLGELIYVEDPSWNGGMCTSFLTVRVMVDTKKPLVVGFWLPKGSGGRIWMETKYEKVFNFCSRYGKQGIAKR